ncbi:MAG TPA: dTDP-4-dehydrorhamnose 3,5-epimerase [Terriglobales bacterium]|nr:dTDP-4-dehydrorhamnose 3,5-epimerase [Terriglobales bacterium]
MASSSLRVVETALADVLVLEPRVFRDARGFFLESYNEAAMSEVGITQRFVQDNHSSSIRKTLRGLHYQICQPQGKLIRVITGEIFDVAVDLRRSSPTFGKWFGVALSGDNYRMIWIPEGFAHGFSVQSDTAHVLYKSTAFYAPECERTIAWNDPDLAIDWQVAGEPIISGKDTKGASLRDAETFA